MTPQGPVAPGAVFRWRWGAASLTSTVEVVDPPREIAWTGTTMGIKAVHVYRFEPKDGGTLAGSEESCKGLLPEPVQGLQREDTHRGIRARFGPCRRRRNAGQAG